MSDFWIVFSIVFTAAWAGIIGFVIGSFTERRHQSKLEEKLREHAISDRSLPMISSGKANYEYGRLIATVQFLDNSFDELTKRVTKLESDRESGAA
jgi:hypothetical protein